MPTTERKIAENLETFKASQDPEALSEASDLLETLQPSVTASLAEKRRFRAEKLQLLLDLLAQIDAYLEPGFDFDNAPSLNVSPPFETGLPSGVAPSGIADPRLRAEYEREIEENHQKAKKYGLQMKLHQLDRRATTQTETHITSNYSASLEDLTKLDELFDASSLNTSRIAGLKKFSRTLLKP